MVHELAHQWFGDSVAPVRWQDVWLNEGHADYYQQVYAEEFFGGDGYTVDYWRDAYARGEPAAGAISGPVAKPTGNDIFTLFSDNVYSGGSLALYALRQVVGERTFSEIERSWVKRYKDESVSTEQFIAHVNRVVAPQPDRVPARLAVRRHRPADAGPPGLDGRPGGRRRAAAARSAAATPSASDLELGIYKR